MPTKPGVIALQTPRFPQRNMTRAIDLEIEGAIMAGCAVASAKPSSLRSDQTFDAAKAIGRPTAAQTQPADTATEPGTRRLRAKTAVALACQVQR